MIELLPHHDGSSLYVSDLSPEIGDVVTVRMRVPDGYGPLEKVWVRSTPDHEPLWTTAEPVGSVDGWTWWQAPITVHNPRHGYRWVMRLADGRIRSLSQAGLTEAEPSDRTDFALVAGNPPPTWAADAVMYQIFPDRFARSAAADEREMPDWAIPAEWTDPVDPVQPGRSQQLYGGDLDGIVDHLDHLEALGVNLVYLTPVFPGASNHRYDAWSFDLVDPLLGGDDAYLRLIEALHARGMRILGDLTSNHSGVEHEWFRAAYGKPDAAESAFYYFLDEHNLTYEAWLGALTLPKFDWTSTELRRRFIDGPGSVVARWLREPYSIDGWRIDVANMTGRFGDVDLNADVRQTIRRTMEEVEPDTLLIAESTNDAAPDLQGDAWHGAMTYPGFTRGVWAWLCDSDQTDGPAWFFGIPAGRPRFTAQRFVEQLTTFTAQLPWRVRTTCMQALDSHDTARFATFAGADVVPLAVGLSMTLPGLPVVFAGDEFGATGGDGELSRTPIPWDRTEDAAVADRIGLYRDLIRLRREHSALASGGLRWIHVDDDALVFVREAEEETVLVLAARGDVDIEFPAIQVPGADDATALYGEATLAWSADSVVVAASGPVFAVWKLAGVDAPPRGIRSS